MYRRAMRCNSPCTNDVNRSSATWSPLLQAFNKPVTSADPACSMAALEKSLPRLWPLLTSLFRLHRRRKKRNEALRCGGCAGSGNRRVGERWRADAQTLRDGVPESGCECEHDVSG